LSCEDAPVSAIFDVIDPITAGWLVAMLIMLIVRSLRGK
jgi:hypothetical protein